MTMSDESDRVKEGKREEINDETHELEDVEQEE
jgi:hypothetical protein